MHSKSKNSQKTVFVLVFFFFISAYVSLMETDLDVLPTEDGFKKLRTRDFFQEEFRAWGSAPRCKEALICKSDLQMCMG